MSKNQDLLNEGIISFFFLGRSPVAPGTFGSLGALIFAYFVIILIGNFAGIILLGFTLVFYYLGLQIAPWCEKNYGKDPGIFVLDEVVGYLLIICSLLFFQIEINLYVWLISFIIFRGFDVVKIWPAKDLEKIEKGHGIMLDDVAAGFQTVILILLVEQFGFLP